ncbi:hypothetical protein SASPL_156135 [Salvia splendens]|uniref:RING-CH-type domain-containing protein n=1 Tax=Salvia splendens TaxID=180675 RepID=A0A8X8VX84_SALSN|nr:hypothetical protein SASPL_156135 [Salvia splendens]
MQSLQEPSSAESESAADSDSGGGLGKDGIVKGRGESSVSQCSVEIVDLEGVHLAKTKRDCRICHLSMDATNQDSGLSMELGCSCKEDLGAAHKQCAEGLVQDQRRQMLANENHTRSPQLDNFKPVRYGSLAQNVVGVAESEPAENMERG